MWRMFVGSDFAPVNGWCHQNEGRYIMTIGLGRFMRRVRWMLVPMFIVIAVAATATQADFALASGPYGPVFGAWLWGYALWAGQSAFARSMEAHKFDEDGTQLPKSAQFVDSISIDPQAGWMTEACVALVVLLIGLALPEQGLGILALICVHLIFVVIWRTRACVIKTAVE